MINLPNDLLAPKGWKCPVCEVGVAPHVEVCPNCTRQASVVSKSTEEIRTDVYKHDYDERDYVPSVTYTDIHTKKAIEKDNE